MKTQELIFTTHEPIYTHEPDTCDPRTIIYCVQVVIIHPNGTKEVSEKREKIKRPPRKSPSILRHLFARVQKTED